MLPEYFGIAMCLLLIFKRVLSYTKSFLVFDDLVLEASVNPVEPLLVTGIRRFKCGRADRGNGRRLHCGGLTGIRNSTTTKARRAMNQRELLQTQLDSAHREVQ